jgi:predicted nucleic acid-binding protein
LRVPEVVSDTSPLQYLHQAELLHLLPALYGHILVPEAVAAELDRGISLGFHLPDVHALSWMQIERFCPTAAPPLPADFGAGERDVLILARRTSDSLALLDDARARHFARLLGIRFTGTLGIVVKAKQQSHVTAVLPILQRLESLGFFLDPVTRAAVLRLAGEQPSLPE